MDDIINHPAHYTKGGIETIDFIKAKLDKEAFTGYMYGSIIKYISRAPHKGNELEDLKKACWFLTRLIEEKK